MGTQARVCEEADATVRAAEQAAAEARLKLDELDRAARQAHVGQPPTEPGIAGRWHTKGRGPGYGFISARSGGPDLFVHSSSILDGARLEQGAAVRFVRVYDQVKQNYRAEEVTGGAAERAAEADADADADAATGKGMDEREGEGPREGRGTKRDYTRTNPRTAASPSAEPDSRQRLTYSKYRL